MQDQLDAARYAMERVRFRVYGEAVLRGELALEDLPRKMAEAMQNYDEIMEQAANGVYGQTLAAEREREHDYIAEFRELMENQQ